MQGVPGFPEGDGLFEHAPTTFIILCLYTVIRAFAYLSFPDPTIFEFRPKSVLENGEVWRIVTANLYIIELRDFCICIFAVFYFRSLEKKLGTAQFVNMLIGTFILTCSVEYGLLLAINYYSEDLVPSEIASGPFCTIFPLLQWSFSEYGKYQAYPKNVPQAPITLMVMILINQIVDIVFVGFSSSSWFVLLCSWLAGALYKENFLCMRTLFVIPRRFFPKRPVDVSTQKIGATADIQRSMRAEFLEQQMIYNSNVLRNPRNASAPPEDLIKQLTDMGFARGNAVQALRSTNNNMEMATNILLNQ